MQREKTNSKEIRENFLSLFSSQNTNTVFKAKERVKSIKSFWIYGAGTNGKELVALLKKNGVTINGVVDDTPAKLNTNYEGYTIINKEQFIKLVNPLANQFLIASIFNPFVSFIDIKKKFKDLKNVDVLSIQEIYSAYNKSFYYIEPIAKILKAKKQYENLFDSLNDVESKITLVRQLELKINKKFSKEKTGLFEILTGKLNKNIHYDYYDCGAYDGDTIIKFYNLFKKNKIRLYAFEPDKHNYLQLLKNAKKVSAICFNNAISDKNEILSFRSEATMGSGIDAKGGDLIQAVSLDEFIPVKAKSLILKFDIERNEMKALKGLKETISKSKPILIVSAYHSTTDLLDIFTYVKKLRPDYKVYLRSHAFDGADVFYYFL